MRAMMSVSQACGSMPFILAFMPPAELCRVGSFSPDFSLTGVWSVRHSSFCASAFNSGEQEDGS